MSTSPSSPYDFSAPPTEAELSILNGSPTQTVSAIDMAAEEEALASQEVGDDSSAGDTNGGQELQAGNEGRQQDGQQVETQAAKTSEAEWRNQSVLDFASTYGLNEVDLERFGNLAEFEQYTVDLDRYASKLFGSVDQQDDQERQQTSTSQAPLPPQNQEASHTAAVAPVISDRPGFKNGKIDPDYFKSNYEEDDPVLAIADHARAVEDRLQEYATAQQQLQEQNRMVLEHLARQEQQAQIREFNMAVDSFAPEFFGKTTDDKGQLVSLTPEQTQRRTKILDAAVNTIMPAIARQRQMSGDQNQPPVTYEQVVRRAARLEYGAELDKIESDRRAAALRAQANKVRGVGRSNGSTPARVSNRDTTDPVEKLLNDPDNIRRWEELVKEGVVRG